MSGYIYLLHFSSPIGEPQTDEQRAALGLPPRKQDYKPHARHYIGWSDNLSGRLMAHRVGQGAKLTQAALRLGIDWRVARVWLGGRFDEKRLKGWKAGPKLCPFCSERPRDPGLDEIEFYNTEAF